MDQPRRTETMNLGYFLPERVPFLIKTHKQRTQSRPHPHPGFLTIDCFPGNETVQSENKKTKLWQTASFRQTDLQMQRKWTLVASSLQFLYVTAEYQGIMRLPGSSIFGELEQIKQCFELDGVHILAGKYTMSNSSLKTQHFSELNVFSFPKIAQ